MGRYLRGRVKQTINNGEAEPPKRDFPLIKKRLVRKSKGKNYEEACREWEFIGLVEEEEVENFNGNCELCNQGGLKLNFRIYNPNTQSFFSVGSTCIKRFLIFKGTSSLNESWDYFIGAAHRFASYKDLEKLLPDVLRDRPLSKDVMLFRKISKEILGSYDNVKVSPDLWKQFIDFLLGPEHPRIEDLERKKKFNRIRDILFNPRSVPVKKPKRVETGKASGSWASKGRRKARARTTLSRSEAYKNPDKK